MERKSLILLVVGVFGGLLILLSFLSFLFKWGWSLIGWFLMGFLLLGLIGLWGWNSIKENVDSDLDNLISGEDFLKKVRERLRIIGFEMDSDITEETLDFPKGRPSPDFDKDGKIMGRVVKVIRLCYGIV